MTLLLQIYFCAFKFKSPDLWELILQEFAAQPFYADFTYYVFAVTARSMFDGRYLIVQ